MAINKETLAQGEVMKWIATFFALLPFCVSAADLTCDARFPGGPEGQPITLTIQIDRDGSVSIPSSRGTLKGVLTATREAYRGYVFADSGEKYWADISRYDGTFAVFPPASSGSTQSVV